MSVCADPLTLEIKSQIGFVIVMNLEFKVRYIHSIIGESAALICHPTCYRSIIVAAGLCTGCRIGLFQSSESSCLDHSVPLFPAAIICLCIHFTITYSYFLVWYTRCDMTIRSSFHTLYSVKKSGHSTGELHDREYRPWVMSRNAAVDASTQSCSLTISAPLDNTRIHVINKEHR